MTALAHLKDAVRQEQAAFVHGRAGEFGERYGEGFQAHLVQTAPVEAATGEEMTELASAFAAAFSARDPVFLIQVAQDDRVASRFVWDVDGVGDWFGTPAGGRQARIHVNALHHFDGDGRIVEEWLYWDNLSWLQQLGALPPFGEPVSPPSVTPAEPLLVGPERRDENAAKVRSAYAAADRGAVERFDEFYRPDFHGFESGGTSIDGVEAMRARVRAFTDAVPRREIVVHETVAEGDVVATHISMTGTFERPLVQATGITTEPNGGPIDIAGIEFYTFDHDGMIALSWPEFDVLDFLQQIDVVPKGAQHRTSAVKVGAVVVAVGPGCV